METSYYTNKGKMRNNNEDNYLIKIEPFTVLAVADGMGGHNAGEVASKLAIDNINNYYFDKNYDFIEQINKVFIETNKLILKSGETNVSYKDMGTTLSIGIIYDKILFIGHVGDSRIYLYREGILEQLTTDHSLVNKLIERKKISANDAFNHPQRHILTQALGTNIELDIETKAINLNNNDILLFCTDGLSDMLRNEEIKLILNMKKDINVLSRELGESAMNKGGHDNITLILSYIK
jgi:PPM family protein phosphatase